MREKKWSVSEEMIVILWLENLRICRAAVTPAIPFPKIRIFYILTNYDALKYKILCERLDYFWWEWVFKLIWSLRNFISHKWEDISDTIEIEFETEFEFENF